MKAEQKKWADYVISGMPQIDAYFKAYPKATKKTAQNQLVNFRKDLGLMGYLDKGLMRIAAKVEERTVEQLSNIEIGNVLTSAKKRELLNLIALGELEFEKLIQVRQTDKTSSDFGNLVYKKMRVKPDLNDRMKAIDLDNRMTGDSFRAKSNEKAPEDLNENDMFNNTTFVFKAKEK